MIHEFGRFRYDAGQKLLFQDGERVALAPKALETLHVLLERRGEVVEKAELMRLVWPDTTVEEVGLARNISLLRKAIDDDNPDSPWIETIPKRGYRFQARVAAVAPPPKRRWVLWAVPAATVLAAGIYYQFYVPSAYLAPKPGPALAVVPFECRCPEEGPARSLDELLVTKLSKSDVLQIVAPSTVRRHQRAGVSMGLMGRLLGLDVLVEGSVETAAGGYRTSARLVDVHTGRIIWADNYSGPLGEAAGFVSEAIQNSLKDKDRNKNE